MVNKELKTAIKSLIREILAESDQDGSIGREFFYRKELDNKGKFHAVVLNDQEQTVLDINSIDQRMQIMTNNDDLDGLKSYLVSRNVMKPEDLLIPEY
jgi:hypothetical protein